MVRRIGAGLLDWSRISCLGIDVVPELVARNTEAFGRRNVRFRYMLITNDVLSTDCDPDLSNTEIARWRPGSARRRVERVSV